MAVTVSKQNSTNFRQQAQLRRAGLCLTLPGVNRHGPDFGCERAVPRFSGRRWLSQFVSTMVAMMKEVVR